MGFLASTVYKIYEIILLTHLIGQNNRAVCKRFGLSCRCIQCREALCTLHSEAGWADHGYQARVSRVSIKSMFKRSKNVAIALKS